MSVRRLLCGGGVKKRMCGSKAIGESTIHTGNKTLETGGYKEGKGNML